MRIVRLLVLVMLLAAGGGAAVWTWTLARHVADVERIGRQTSARIDRLDVLLDEVADQELIYVASGGLDRSWLEHVVSVLQQIATDAPTLAAQSLAAATPHARAVSGTSSALEDIDARARDNLGAHLDLTAADLILIETRSARRALREDVRALRTAEEAAVAAARLADLRQAGGVIAVVALLGLCVGILWSRAPVRQTTTGVQTVAPPRPALSSVDLAEVAALCTAIGRLEAGTELPRLLERAGALVGASGVVVWMGAGEELFAAATHGYDANQVSRLSPIGRTSLNATAAAWRSGRLQTVAAESGPSAGVVAPVLGQDRCIGVLAIEVPPGRETHLEIQAVAALIAAQLATVLVARPGGSATELPADVLPFDRAAGAST